MFFVCSHPIRAVFKRKEILMSGRILLDHGNRAYDAGGAPIGQAKLKAFVAGGTTAAALYTDATLATAHADPLVADGNGFFPPMWAAEAARLDVKIYGATETQFNTPVRQYTAVTPLAGLEVAADRAALAGLPVEAGDTVLLAEDGRTGLFKARTATIDLGGDVTADPNQGARVGHNSLPIVFTRESEILTTRMFGVVHDAVYNPATGIWTGTDNTTALQRAMNWFARRGGGELIFSEGYAQVTKPVVTTDFVRIIGEGHEAAIVNNSAGQFGGAFVIGHWGAAAVGKRPLLSQEEFHSGLTRYECSQAVSRADTKVPLSQATTAAVAAATFTPGRIVVLITSEYWIQSTGQEVKQPHDLAILRVKRVEGRYVHFDTEIGFDSASPPQLCVLLPGEGESDFGGFHFRQGVRIENLGIFGTTVFGHGPNGAYNCHGRDLWGSWYNAVMLQGFAESSLDGVRGSFRNRVLETKIGTRDSWVANVDVTCQTTGEDNMFSLGEQCRTLEFRDFRVAAPVWSGVTADNPDTPANETDTNPNSLVRLSGQRGCSLRRGSIFAPAAIAAAFEVSGGEGYRPSDFVADRIDVEWAGHSAIRTIASDHPPLRYDFGHCRFVSTAADTGGLYAALLSYGSDIDVHDCRFPAAFRFDISIPDSAERDNQIGGALYAPVRAVVAGTGVAASYTPDARRGRTGPNGFETRLVCENVPSLTLNAPVGEADGTRLVLTIWNGNATGGGSLGLTFDAAYEELGTVAAIPPSRAHRLVFECINGRWFHRPGDSRQSADLSGANLVANPGFIGTGQTVWTLRGGTAIVGDKLEVTTAGTSGQTYQARPEIVAGRPYLVRLKLENRTAGFANVNVGGAVSAGLTASGTIEDVVVAGAAGTVGVGMSGTLNAGARADDVEVRAI
jgi:hypothetical protein